MKVDLFRRTGRALAPVCAFAFLTLIIGCAPPHMNASKDLISVSVLPASEPVWTYTISTKHAENLVAVEFISPSDLSDVTVTPLPEVWELDKTYSPNRIKIELRGSIFGKRATQFRSLQVMLKSKNKDKRNGDIKIQVTDFRGRVTTIEPVAGPV